MNQQGFLVLLAVCAASAKFAPLLEVAEPLVGEYIVVLNQAAVSVEHHLASFPAHLSIAARHVYGIGHFKGYSASLGTLALHAVRNSPDVEYVERDSRMSISYEQDKVNDGTCLSQQNPRAWGLTRLSIRALNLAGNYHYPGTAGTNVNAYIVDTGVYIQHQEFQGRAVFGFKADASWSDTDANGHGTHVAGTVGGATVGVAKNASIIAVKVLGDDGSGTNSGVIAGINYVTTQHKNKRKPSTANMSLGGGASRALDDALKSSIAAGVVYVVAAGNDNKDACAYSPARLQEAITTGSTDVCDASGAEEDCRSSFSNYGSCVDVLAPGSLIYSAWIGGPSTYNTISGTSMASPLVCGVATLYHGLNPQATPAEVDSWVKETATSGIVDLRCTTQACKASPNLLIHSTCGVHNSKPLSSF